MPIITAYRVFSNLVVSVSVVDDTDDTSVTGYSLAVVDKAGPEIAVEGPALVLSAGTEFSGTVARFTDTEADGTVEGYTATIHWGDGNISTATVTANGDGGFDISDTHSYTDRGVYKVLVTVSEEDGDPPRLVV